MRFLTPHESDAWIAKAPPTASAHSLSIHLPPESGRLLLVAHTLVGAITFRQPCLLRVTECEIWPSSNNWHLYYRLRQSYGDRLLMDEAPGHLFLDHETEDFATFLHLAMLFGWDAVLRPSMPYVSGRLSHDGFVDLDSESADELVAIQKVMGQAKLKAEMRS